MSSRNTFPEPQPDSASYVRGIARYSVNLAATIELIGNATNIPITLILYWLDSKSNKIIKSHSSHIVTLTNQFKNAKCL